MPNKNPDYWTIVYEFVQPYLHGIYAFVMSFVVAAFRICYVGKEDSPVRVFLESSLCGLLAVSSRYVFIQLEMNEDLAVAFGAIIAMFGIDKVRELSLRFVSKKVRGNNEKV